MNEEKRRDLLQQITTWAEKYNLGDEDWVEENFEFNDDGSVICNTDLELNSMTEPDFPESIKYVEGNLYLDGLTSAEGLKLPNSMSNLYLNGLTSAEGLELPDEIECLSLNGLTSINGLKFNSLKLTGIKIECTIFLKKVPNEEKEELREKYFNLRIE